MRDHQLSTRIITVTAVLMAMNIIMSTSVLSVPVPGGHMYLNDVIIVTAAVLLEPFYAFLVGGVGAKMKGAGVTVVKENAVIKGRVPGGFAVTAAGQDYEGAKLLIATGSSAVVPPIPGVRENLGGFVITNKEVLELPEVPKNFAIIGGGVIGLEMAAYYVTARSHVTVIEMLDHIAGPTDREISTMLQKEYAKKGVDFTASAGHGNIPERIVSTE